MEDKPNADLHDGPRQIALEIYRQKYEVFRHFDRLRWQAPGLAFLVGAVFLARTYGDAELPHWWALVTFGTVAVICAWTMRRIAKQLETNRAVLNHWASMIGDDHIPKRTGITGANTVFQVFMLVLGVVVLISGVIRCVTGA